MLKFLKIIKILLLKFNLSDKRLCLFSIKSTQKMNLRKIILFSIQLSLVNINVTNAQHHTLISINLKQYYSSKVAHERQCILPSI